MRININIIAMFILSIFVLSACGGFDKTNIKKYEAAINNNEELNMFLDGNATIERTSSASAEDFTVYFFTLFADVNERFIKLSDEEKYGVFLNIITVLKSEGYSDLYSTDCGKRKGCSVKFVQFNHNDDVYEYKKVMLNDHYSLVLNGEEVSSTETKKKKMAPKINDDSETTVQDKGGSDWSSLSENQKYHAVSNALHNLNQQGFTILEGEYYYIDALDAFYSDSTTKSTSVSKALGLIGTLSGTIIK
ncbi:hypothetical protein V6B14_08510 [Sporosarcina psychrophila]|uniref:hypothetical protein n=1 Tax=Sporosarcina psychrophila TaxID=1476 RepID=UPI0030CAE34D